jgi:hypothetical protein
MLAVGTASCMTDRNRCGDHNTTLHMRVQFPTWLIVQTETDKLCRPSVCDRADVCKHCHLVWKVANVLPYARQFMNW